MIENLEIDMPTLVDSGEISLGYQDNFIEQYSIFEEFEEKVKFCIEKISSTRPDINYKKSTKTVKISELFDLVKGKSKYTNKYFTTHKGNYPVFSSQTSNDGIIAQIDTYDFDCECLTWTTDGVYAGTVFYRNGKFSMTTHCGAMCIKKEFKNTVYIPYVYAFLSEVLKHNADGEQNKRLTVNILKDVIVEIPINKSNCFDIEMQKTYASTFEKFTGLQQEVISKLNSLLGITIV
jgi:restriction endonuclease S subunit